MAIKKDEEDVAPTAERGDSVYFRHKSGPCSGAVAASGRTGCIVDCEHGRNKVRWEHYLGHKARIQPNYRVVDDGDDGLIVQDGDGRRRYVHDPDTGDEPIRKSYLPAVLLFGGDVMKAIKNGPGLSLQPVTDKSGRQTKRWMRTSKPVPKERQHAPADTGARRGYGTHNLSIGGQVSFKMGTLAGDGKIVGMHGDDGAHVEDSAGRQHKVLWHEITGHKPAPGNKKITFDLDVRGSQKPVPASQFSATDYAKEHDDPHVTAPDIMKYFPPDTVRQIAAVQNRLSALEDTLSSFSVDGKWQSERKALHQKIIAEFMSPQKIKAAKPADGESPTFTLLGGRGGSGKGWFKNKVYDEESNIVIDADEIKKLLPEYEGWNAAQVHEESSDLVDFIVDQCREHGLSVVLDGTLKSSKSAIARTKAFKGSGFRIEAHYMHLPRQDAAKRAVARFLGETQRYVPVDVVLSNTTNEASFEQVRALADAWSFRDNNVPEHHDPILISHSGPAVEDGGLKRGTEEGNGGS